MIDHMIFAHHKYNSKEMSLKERQSTYGKKNAIKSLRERLKLYLYTGNTEWLIDVANCAMIEYMHPTHKKAHFRATSSEESPGVEGQRK